MAIAFDAASQGSGNTGTLTVPHTCTGSNRILFVHCAKDPTAISGITYDSVALTKVVTAGSAGESTTIWMLVNPNSGTHDIVASFTPTPSLYLHAASYTGAAQSGQPDNSAAKVDGTPNCDITLTTVADNCWAVIGVKDQGDGMTAGTGTTLRGTYDIGVIADGNSAKTPAGSYTLTINGTSATLTGAMVSFSPATASAIRLLASTGVGT